MCQVAEGAIWYATVLRTDELPRGRYASIDEMLD